jgi:hypothetical protein
LHAYQALAIDERRAEFPPTLWTAAAPGQTMEQVWFSGVHCDVGGSYPADSSGSALSDLTLAWMMNKAAALGLEFVAYVSSNYPLPMDPKLALDTKHESWNVGWFFPKNRSIAANSTISDSVFTRCEHDNSYHPANLTFTSGQLAAGYQKAYIISQSAAMAAGSPTT